MRWFGPIAAAVLLVGCGEPPDIRPPWAELPSGGEVNEGVRTYLQSARAKYVKGKNIWMRARIENAGKRRLFLDRTAGWAEAFVELEGPSGRVEVIEKELAAEREFVEYKPGDADGWEITNLRTDAWEIRLPLEVGSYKATLVYPGRMSSEWNRMAVAGGTHEGERLWVGEARSNEVEFEVVEPPPKK